LDSGDPNSSLQLVRQMRYQLNHLPNPLPLNSESFPVAVVQSEWKEGTTHSSLTGEKTTVWTGQLQEEPRAYGPTLGVFGTICSKGNDPNDHRCLIDASKAPAGRTPFVLMLGTYLALESITAKGYLGHRRGFLSLMRFFFFRNNLRFAGRLLIQCREFLCACRLLLVTAVTTFVRMDKWRLTWMLLRYLGFPIDAPEPHTLQVVNLKS